jgi:hypothetical protein
MIGSTFGGPSVLEELFIPNLNISLNEEKREREKENIPQIGPSRSLQFLTWLGPKQSPSFARMLPVQPKTTHILQEAVQSDKPQLTLS